MRQSPPQALDRVPRELLELVVHLGLVEAELGRESARSATQLQILVEPALLGGAQLTGLIRCTPFGSRHALSLA